MAFILVVAWIGLYGAIFSGIGQAGRTATAGVAAKKDWQTHSACGMTLDAPGSFRKFDQNFGEAKKMMEAVENGRCDFADISVAALHVKYRQGVQLSLDKAAKSAIAAEETQARTKMGMAMLSSSTKPTVISGQRALRVDASFAGGSWWHKRSLRMIGLWIEEGHSFYCVDIEFDGASPQAMAEAERVVKSVKLRP